MHRVFENTPRPHLIRREAAKFRSFMINGLQDIFQAQRDYAQKLVPISDNNSLRK